MLPLSISTVRLIVTKSRHTQTDTIITEEEAEKQAKELVKVFKDENPGADRVPKVTGHYCDGKLRQPRAIGRQLTFCSK
jgi:hypothetical protein